MAKHLIRLVKGIDYLRSIPNISQTKIVAKYYVILYPIIHSAVLGQLQHWKKNEYKNNGNGKQC
jgi:hypothetical protein